MRIDIRHEKCSGCKLCQQICAIAHFKEINPKKAAISIKAQFPVPGVFKPELCDQCGECEAACPADAITFENGAYVVDPEECTMCEECVEACPKGAVRCPSYASHAIKCDLCMKCTEVCNTGALVPVHGQETGKDLPPWTDSVEPRCA